MANHTTTCRGESVVAMGAPHSLVRFQTEHPTWWYDALTDRLLCRNCSEFFYCGMATTGRPVNPIRTLNRITLIGFVGAHVGAPREMSERNGIVGKVSRLTLATFRDTVDQHGEQCECTDWHSVLLPEPVLAGRAVSKGDRVLIEGTLVSGTRTVGGVEVPTYNILADSMVVLDAG